MCKCRKDFVGFQVSGHDEESISAMRELTHTSSKIRRRLRRKKEITNMAMVERDRERGGKISMPRDIITRWQPAGARAS